MPKVSKPRKHGNRWQINWVGPDGRRHWSSHNTHRAATEELRAQQVESDAIRRGAIIDIDTGKTWADLFGLWCEVKHAKGTLRDDICRAEKHLNPRLGILPLTAITPHRLSRLERELTSSGTLSIGTVRHVLSLVRAMLNLAVEHAWLAKAPKVRLPVQPERPHDWIQTKAEIHQLLIVARNHSFPGLLPFYTTAILTGLRAGELCALRWRDVDLKNRLITVQRSFKKPYTKSKNIRRVPITDELRPVLQDWKLACSHRSLVFPNRVGKMHAPGARVMRSVFHRCLREAEIERVRFHDLRHTFASHWMLDGGSLYKLQHILGHESVETTERYAHLSADAFKGDWGRMSGLVPMADGGEVIQLPSPSQA